MDAEYDIAGADTQYKIERVGDEVRIYFQGSVSWIDWLHNLFFLKEPYKDMGDASWKCHGGFLQCWNNVKDIVGDNIRDESIKRITIVGYSHGAALAVFCHEYCWFHRPDLRENLRGYGFGCPRVVGHFKIDEELKKRWKNFTIIRNNNDMVTHVPPAFFKFCHVNEPLQIGDAKNMHPIKSHLPEAYISSLCDAQ
jgi:predicted lipase